MAFLIGLKGNVHICADKFLSKKSYRCKFLSFRVQAVRFKNTHVIQLFELNWALHVSDEAQKMMIMIKSISPLKHFELQLWTIFISCRTLRLVLFVQVQFRLFWLLLVFFGNLLTDFYLRELFYFLQIIEGEFRWNTVDLKKNFKKSGHKK